MLSVSNFGGFSGQKLKYPNQPGGFQIVAETDDNRMPQDGTDANSSHVLHGSISDFGTGADLTLGTVGLSPEAGYPPIPFCPTGQRTVLQQRFPTGLTPGNGPAGSFFFGQNNTLSGANGGPSADEFGAFYVSNWFNIFGNGINFETVGAQLWKIDYFGATYNNLTSSGGFTQLEYIMNNLTPNNGTNPATDTLFLPAIYTQNFANQDQIQNMNPGFNLHVGRWHQCELLMTTGTDQGANGGVDIWLDGVHVVHWTNTQFLNSSSTFEGQPGSAGFTSYSHTPVWGGGGGNNKSRNDYVLYGHIYVSGLFLRSRQ